MSLAQLIATVLIGTTISITAAGAAPAAKPRVQVSPPRACRADDPVLDPAKRQSLMKDARFVPEIRDGRATGMRVYSLQADSPFAKLGVRNRDMLVAIGGVPLTSPESALRAYARTGQAGCTWLTVLREGKTVELSFWVRDVKN